ncbi:MAG TPA: hypothetical protein DC042_17885 [Bacteroidales bacterium]|nr:hypothetical protein [Bacteroidales bacterium]
MNTEPSSRPQLSGKLLGWLASGLCVVCLAVYAVNGPWFVKPIYQSESLIFVPLTILSKQIEQQGIGFASDREIDAHIQILESGLMRDSLIQRFSLTKAYGIDTKNPGGQSRLHRILAAHTKIRKTQFGSVSIRVDDTDPARAALMANAIVELGNLIKEDLLLANRKGALDYAQTLYDSKAADVANLEQRIDSVTGLPGGLEAATRNRAAKLQTIYGTELQELAGRKNHLEREQRSFETELPKAYVISSAIPDYEPVSPRRLLMVLAAAAIYLFLMAVIIIIMRDVRLISTKD